MIFHKATAAVPAARVFIQTMKPAPAICRAMRIMSMTLTVIKKDFFDRDQALEFYEEKLRQAALNVKLFWRTGKGGHVEFEEGSL